MTLIAFLNIVYSGSVLWLSLVVVLFILFTIYIYKNTNPVNIGWKRNVLILIRSIVIILLLLLFLKIKIIFGTEKVIEPVNILLVDNSKSITSQDSLSRNELINNFAAKLSDKSQLKLETFSFGDKVSKLDIDKIVFSGKSTNFEKVYNFIDTSSKNVSSVVLLSDGLINDGLNPINNNFSGFPSLYIVGIGDTTILPDLEITTVISSDIISKDETSEILVNTSFSGIDSISFNLVLKVNNKIIENRNVTTSNKAFDQFTFDFTPNKIGDHKLEVEAISGLSEQTKLNNIKTKIIKVIDRKYNVLILSSTPSADLGAIIKSLKNIKHISVTKFIESSEKQNTNDLKNGLEESDVIFIINYPASFSKIENINYIIKYILDKNKSTLFITSNNIDLNKFNLFTKISSLQIQTNQKKIIQAQSIINESNPYSISLFQDKNYWNDLPPLNVLANDIILSKSTTVLANGKSISGSIGLPIILIKEDKRLKVLTILASGIWKWRLNSFDNNINNFDGLILNTIKLLTENIKNKHLTLTPNRKVYLRGQNINISASLKDNSMNPINNATIKLNNIDKGINDTLTFVKMGGNYTLDFQAIKPGNTTYQIFAYVNNQLFAQDTLNILVENLFAEDIEQTIDKKYLIELAKLSGGKYFNIFETDSLINILNSQKSVEKIINQESKFNLWFNEWTLYAILFLLTIEWTIRKRIGMI